MSASPDRVWKFSGQIAICGSTIQRKTIHWSITASCGLFCQLLVAEQFLADRTGLWEVHLRFDGRAAFSYIFVSFRVESSTRFVPLAVVFTCFAGVPRKLHFPCDASTAYKRFHKKPSWLQVDNLRGTSIVFHEMDRLSESSPLKKSSNSGTIN